MLVIDVSRLAVASGPIEAKTNSHTAVQVDGIEAGILRGRARRAFTAGLL